MADVREQILARLAVVCEGVEGIAAVAPDALDAAGLARPAVIIHSGGEDAVQGDIGATVARASRFSAMQFMAMRPPIQIHARAEPAAVRTVFALYRRRIVSAALNDATLRSYVGPNGNIRFISWDLDRPEPEARERRADLVIEFTYPFRLADITEA